MKKAALFILVVMLVGLLTACGRGGNGEPEYGAGGGQSLREGSTSPYHSNIAQDETYQTLLGLNILLYPAPVDDPKFETFGALHWEMDPTEFVAAMEENFSGQMGESPVYEPVVAQLQDHPFVAEVQEAVFGGEPVQVGWIYGRNGTMDFLEFNDANVVLIPANDVVLFAGSEDKLDQTEWTYATKDTQAFFVPDHVIVELFPTTLRSAPVRVIEETGYLAAVITPAGIATEEATPGQGMDQALVANSRWVFAFPETEGNYYAGLTGDNTAIEPADSSPRYSE